MERSTRTHGATGPGPATGLVGNALPIGSRPAVPTHDAIWLIRSVMLLATAMMMFSSEIVAAAPTSLDRPAPGPLPASASAPAPALAESRDPAPPRSPIPDPPADRRTVGDAAVGEPSRGVDERDTEPAAAPDSTRDVTAPSDSIDVGPADAGAIDALTRPVVVLYGDSLAWEARDVFQQALDDHPVDVVTRTFGGTAICDWHEKMIEDAATLQPGLVVIEFVGNNYTPCMQDAAGEPLVGAALADRYGSDAEFAIATFAAAGTQVVLAGAPISRPATAMLDLHHAPLNAVYEELGRRRDGVRYVDAGSALLDDGAWTPTLPCLPVEPCPESGDAHNVVRSPDGLHFCPSSAEAPEGVTGDCPVWSSGAFRFGTELARPVLESLAAVDASPGGAA